MSEPTESMSQLRVMRGTPSPAELAALVAVLAARTQHAGAASAAAAGRPQPARSAWGRPAAALRRMPPPGPGAWRASMRPG